MPLRHSLRCRWSRSGCLRRRRARAACAVQRATQQGESATRSVHGAGEGSAAARACRRSPWGRTLQCSARSAAPAKGAGASSVGTPAASPCIALLSFRSSSISPARRRAPSNTSSERVPPSVARPCASAAVGCVCGSVGGWGWGWGRRGGELEAGRSTPAAMKRRRTSCSAVEPSNGAAKPTRSCLASSERTPGVERLSRPCMRRRPPTPAAVKRATRPLLEAWQDGVGRRVSGAVGRRAAAAWGLRRRLPAALWGPYSARQPAGAARERPGPAALRLHPTGPRPTRPRTSGETT